MLVLGETDVSLAFFWKGNGKMVGVKVGCMGCLHALAVGYADTESMRCTCLGVAR